MAKPKPIVYDATGIQLSVDDVVLVAAKVNYGAMLVPCHVIGLTPKRVRVAPAEELMTKFNIAASRREYPKPFTTKLVAPEQCTILMQYYCDRAGSV